MCHFLLRHRSKTSGNLALWQFSPDARLADFCNALRTHYLPDFRGRNFNLYHDHMSQLDLISGSSEDAPIIAG